MHEGKDFLFPNIGKILGMLSVIYIASSIISNLAAHLLCSHYEQSTYTRSFKPLRLNMCTLSLDWRLGCA